MKFGEPGKYFEKMSGNPVYTIWVTQYKKI